MHELPSQPITQVYLAPKTPFWEQDGYAPSLFTDSLAGMLAAARHGEDPRQVTSLTAWIMGDAAAALDELPADEIGRRVIADIERIRPAARGQLELLGVYSWGSGPVCGRCVGVFSARSGDPLGRRHGPFARTAAFLRRASRDREPRNGGRDGVRRTRCSRNSG